MAVFRIKKRHRMIATIISVYNAREPEGGPVQRIPLKAQNFRGNGFLGVQFQELLDLGYLGEKEETGDLFITWIGKRKIPLHLVTKSNRYKWKQLGDWFSARNYPEEAQ